MRLNAFIRAISVSAAWATALIGALGLLRHLPGVSSLAPVRAGTPEVSAPIAVSLILLAAGVLLQGRRLRRRVAWPLALVVLVFALLAVGAMALRLPFPPGGGVWYVTAGCLGLLALSLLCLETAAADWLALLPGAIGLVALAGHGYAATLAVNAGRVATVPLAVAAGLLGVALGVMGARPATGLTRPLTLEGPAGVMSRRILPVAILVSLLTVWLRLEAQQSGIVSTESGAGLLAVAFIVTLTVLTHQTARALERTDTGRAQAEAATREAEARYREMFSRAPVGLFRALPDGTLLERNEALGRLLGESVHPGSATFNLFDRLLDAARREYIRTRLADRDSVTGIEVQVRRADGTPAWVQLTAAPVAGLETESAPYLQGAMLDVTTRRRLEQELAQAQKLEALGRLAGGVAHDFNNLLTVVNAGSDFVLQSLEVGDPRREDLEDVIDATRRAGELTQQLLAYSRQQVLAPQVLSVNDVIESVAGLLRRTLGEDIQLITPLAPDAGLVLADRVRLEQVLLNLAINARDAMPGGGLLRITTSRETLDESHAAECQEVVPGEYVLIAVSDTGEGMDDATRLRIFDPFFTTKAPGRGTGLGLATVHGIIRQSRGHIWVYSEPGEGTTFKVYLPRTTASPSPPVTPLPREAITGSGRILLVEDDATVRRLVERMLVSLGYEVLVATGSEEALALAAEPGIRFDLVLTDVVMPGRSGRELVDLLRQHHQFAVVFMSGYTADDVLRHGIERRAVHFLQKPFTVEALGRRIREALATRPHRGGTGPPTT